VGLSVPVWAAMLVSALESRKTSVQSECAVPSEGLLRVWEKPSLVAW
jgi:hypothetical protein